MRRWLAKLWALPEEGKVADRPHPVAIVLGVLGPTTAILAITFTFMGYRLSIQSLRVSQQSLETSQRALEVGQRAYLFLSNGRVRITYGKSSPLSAFREKMGLEEQEELTPSTISIIGQVENVGNTPARILSIRIQFVSKAYQGPFPDFDDGSEPVAPGKFVVLHTETVQNFGDVGRGLAKSLQHTLLPGALIALDRLSEGTDESRRKAKAMQTLVDGIDSGHYRILGEIAYADVFETRHAMRWCWGSGRIGFRARRTVAGPEEWQSRPECNVGSGLLPAA